MTNDEAPRARAVALLLAACALAAAPPPTQEAPPSLYAGRWYDIAHTPNARQKDCFAPWSEFTGWDGAAFSIAQACRRGSLSAPPQMFRAKARIVAGSANTRFRAFFLGGLISQEYWILDHASDNGWAILATPGGHYVWLMARTPVLDANARATALRRIAVLGYDAAHLAVSAQAPR